MRTLIQQNPELLRLIARFHGTPSQLVHRDRWPVEISDEVRNLVQSSVAGQRRLTNWMTSEWQIDPDFQWSFEKARHRLALLASEQLESLIIHCGAATHAAAITRNIDRSTQIRYKEVLGENAFNFAIKRAAFVTRGLPDSLTSVQPQQDEIKTSVRNCGLNCIAICLHDVPVELMHRVTLMLPPSKKMSLENSATDVESVWPFVRRLLLTEVAQELNSCFN